MGDYADMALDEIMDWDEEVERGYYDNPDNWEDGMTPMYPFYSAPKPHGPGKCPSCGNKTLLKNGKYGAFYGCVNYPKCCGSRGY